MPEYKVYRSETFDKAVSGMDKDFQDRVDKLEENLSENPYTGRPLDAEWFREKRYGKYRIYFLIYDDVKSVFMAGISEKKDQQKVINTIRLMMDFLKEELENLADKDKFT